ncbi:MAG: alpha/beta hydrolase fold domain-containing protein [Aristaeellaceae bacterium]
MTQATQTPGRGGAPRAEHQPRMARIEGIARRTLDVPYAHESPSQHLDVYLPGEGDGPFPALIYTHGGGFAFGDKRDHHLEPVLQALSLGIAVVAVEYRLSGEAIFPAAVLDVRQAVRHVRRHAAQYRIDPAHLVAIGGSAGGNLAAMLGMNVPNGAFPGESAGACGEVQPDVLAAVDQFGPMDFKAMDAQARAGGVGIADHDLPDSPESRYLGICVAKAPEALCSQANPLSYAGPRMGRLLVQHGTADRLVPCQQSEEFVRGLKEKGLGDRVTFTPLPGADHDDARFASAENLGVVFGFIRQAIRDADGEAE